MTIRDNSSSKSMTKYIAESLDRTDCDKDNATLYSESDKKSTTMINNWDISLLIKCLRDIITNDFEKIRKLTKYLRNVV